jgi:hypothetical protein
VFNNLDPDTREDFQGLHKAAEAAHIHAAVQELLIKERTAAANRAAKDNGTPPQLKAGVSTSQSHPLSYYKAASYYKYKLFGL